MDENEVKEYWEHVLRILLKQKEDIMEEINVKISDLDHINNDINEMFRIGKELNIIQ